jgi:hypothetical protein
MSDATKTQTTLFTLSEGKLSDLFGRVVGAIETRNSKYSLADSADAALQFSRENPGQKVIVPVVLIDLTNIPGMSANAGEVVLEGRIYKNGSPMFLRDGMPEQMCTSPLKVVFLTESGDAWKIDGAVPTSAPLTVPAQLICHKI